ncbi:MAG: quercetin 2,3-dioxygenase, partial [Arenimonas sp.]
KIAQQAKLYSALMNPDAQLQHLLQPGRLGWVQVISGRVEVNGKTLTAGDGLGLVEESGIKLRADQDSQLLVFDLPR